MTDDFLTSPFCVGNVSIRNRVLLAPMSGVTDVPFRRLAWQFGAGLVVTEMIASRELARGNDESMLRIAGAGLQPHMAQIAGCDAHWMGEAARVAVDHGADLIDINMGCPAKKVIGGYAGSALMRDPVHALSLIEATLAASTVPVTLKMRLGWDEQSMNAGEIAKSAEMAGVSMITVHGRTRSQFYNGTADWEAIARVRDEVQVPFVANGDVRSADDAAAILRRTGADAVMVGRAAQGQPWILGRIAGCSSSDDIQVSSIVTEHYRSILKHYGENIGIRHARKHLDWYLGRHASGCSPQFRQEIMTSKDPAAVIAAIENAFEESAGRNCQMDRAA